MVFPHAKNRADLVYPDWTIFIGICFSVAAFHCLARTLSGLTIFFQLPDQSNTWWPQQSFMAVYSKVLMWLRIFRRLFLVHCDYIGFINNNKTSETGPEGNEKYYIASYCTTPNFYSTALHFPYLDQTVLPWFTSLFNTFLYHTLLEDTARYAGLLLAPAEGFGLQPKLFLPFGQKNCFLYIYFTPFGIFW